MSTASAEVGGDNPPNLRSCESEPQIIIHANKHLFHSDDLALGGDTGNKRSQRRNMRKGRRTWGNHSFFGDFDDHDDDSRRAPSRRESSAESSNRSCGGSCALCMGRTDKWCTEHNEQCWRGLKHCWFFVLFVWSFLWTSIARIALFVDIFVTTALFLRCPDNLNLRFGQSAIDIFILCLIRCLVYFLLFAYRCRGQAKAWSGVMAVTGIALFYIAVKLGAAFNSYSSDEVKHLIVFQLCFIVAEVALFQFLRKRPISVTRAKPAIQLNTPMTLTTTETEEAKLIHGNRADNSRDLLKTVHQEIQTSHSPEEIKAEPQLTHETSSQ